MAKQCRNGLAVPSIPNARTSIVTRRQNPGSVGRVYRLVYRSSMASQREQQIAACRIPDSCDAVFACCQDLIAVGRKHC